MSAVFRLCASSYSGALLTIGTHVKSHRDPLNTASIGTIHDIQEALDGGLALVLWPDGRTNWRPGRNLDRVGKAARGPK